MVVQSLWDSVPVFGQGRINNGMASNKRRGDFSIFAEIYGSMDSVEEESNDGLLEFGQVVEHSRGADVSIEQFVAAAD